MLVFQACFFDVAIKRVPRVLRKHHSLDMKKQYVYILVPPSLLLSVATAEWSLPLEHLNSALAMVMQLAQDYAVKHKQYSLLPIYVRLVKTDDLFLSPASKFRPDESSNSEYNCYIEVRAQEGHTICIHV